MIPETPFFTGVATVSMTLAGFAGLLVAFRRGDQLRSFDVFHLREIAETGLATALIARPLAAVVIALITFQIVVFA